MRTSTRCLRRRTQKVEEIHRTDKIAIIASTNVSILSIFSLTSSSLNLCLLESSLSHLFCHNIHISQSIMSLSARHMTLRLCTRSSRQALPARRNFTATAVTRGIAAWDPSLGHSWEPHETGSYRWNRNDPHDNNSTSFSLRTSSASSTTSATTITNDKWMVQLWDMLRSRKSWIRP